jgi:putative SOS response-associated peptidase YedK
MCGRYGFSVKKAKDLYDRFEVINTLDDYQPRWNIAPGQMNPVITAHSPKQISRMFWGLIPSFARDKDYAYKTINARAETVSLLPSFRSSLRNRRCLVPATGFYEPDKISKKSAPFTWHYFELKDKSPFAFAGIYDIWINPVTQTGLYSYTIITTTPNKIVGQFHDRMPVILSREDEDKWINPDLNETDEILSFLKPYPQDLMEQWQVADEVRNARNEGEELIKPVAPESKPVQQSIL